MRTLLSAAALFWVLLLFNACQVKEQPITYGQVNCAHCQMTVSDRRYGSEMVSKTGKAYFFDSAECLIWYLDKNKDKAEKAELLLVTDFLSPEKLLDARQAHYLQSINLPSPMGMYLTAFANEPALSEIKQEKGGRILNWEQAMEVVKKNQKPD
jgi:copper chaperone NosL